MLSPAKTSSRAFEQGDVSRFSLSVVPFLITAQKARVRLRTVWSVEGLLQAGLTSRSISLYGIWRGTVR